MLTVTQCAGSGLGCDTTAPPPPPRAEKPAWAWCGVMPPAPGDTAAESIAIEAVRALAYDGGIDATFGPCIEPDWNTYSPAFPGQRYASPATYMRLVKLNASVGMQTVVYDSRVWSTEPRLRQAAIDYWTPVLHNIAAWDMGDEFDPASDQWQVLINRIEQVLFDVTPATGVHPYTNHLASAVGLALDTVPGSDRMLSFDQYWSDKGALIAAQVDHRTSNLMCAINALQHGTYVVTPEADIAALDPWCDSWLIFGGVLPIQPVPTFGEFSLVDTEGNSTEWAWQVKRATS